MPGMPKVFEKGPTIEALEMSMSSALARATVLLKLRRSAEDNSSAARCLSEELTESEILHLERDWFGNGAAPFWSDDAVLPDSVEDTMRLGLIEAIETSLGLKTGEPLDRFVTSLAAASLVDERVATKQLVDVEPALCVADSQLELRRDLPIEMFWICELPLFECFVSWNSRQVTFAICTPSVDHQLLFLPARSRIKDDAKTSAASGIVAIQAGVDGEPPSAVLFDSRTFSAFRG